MTPLTQWKKDEDLSYKEILDRLNRVLPKNQRRKNPGAICNVFLGLDRPSPTLANALMDLTGLRYEDIFQAKEAKDDHTAA